MPAMVTVIGMAAASGPIEVATIFEMGAITTADLVMPIRAITTVADTITVKLTVSLKS